MTPPSDGWRVDDLARRADMTVDTVRYYQREGLVPEGRREGRVKLYGPAHLDRLERIRELQRRGFSLAAIRILLGRGRDDVLEGIFADRGDRASFTLDELVERSGIDPELAGALLASGLLRDPADFGRDTYDGDDLDLLRTMGELHGMGIPTKALLELGRIYAEGIEATQREVVELFTTGGQVDWGPGELETFQESSAQRAGAILPLARQLVDYAHHRTIQRLALDAAEQGRMPAPETA